MTIPENGYLAVYLSNASDFAGCSSCTISEGDVYFDQLQITFTKGHLQEENGYYPFGLPMAAMGGSAIGMTPNRQKYQSNEYITEAGLDWMSFGARQYDPQIGRFLSVDPMASQGGQEMLSPYQAMGNNPVSGTDPGGTMPDDGGGGDDPPPVGPPLGDVATDGGIHIFSPLALLMNLPVFAAPGGNAMSGMAGFAEGGSGDPLVDWSPWAGAGEGLSDQLVDDGIMDAIASITGVGSPINISNMECDLGSSGDGGDEGGGGGAISGDDDGGAGGDQGGSTDGDKGDKGDKGNKQESKSQKAADKVAEQSDKVSFGLGVAGYSVEKAGYKTLDRELSLGGDAVGFYGLHYEYTQYNQGKVSGLRLGYDATGLGASTAAEYILGAEAGIETGGAFIYGAAVYKAGNTIWQDFKISYTNWYNNFVHDIGMNLPIPNPR